MCWHRTTPLMGGCATVSDAYHTTFRPHITLVDDEITQDVTMSTTLNSQIRRRRRGTLAAARNMLRSWAPRLTEDTTCGDCFEIVASPRQSRGTPKVKNFAKCHGDSGLAQFDTFRTRPAAE
jgi:hypothetical protein